MTSGQGGSGDWAGEHEHVALARARPADRCRRSPPDRADARARGVHRESAAHRPALCEHRRRDAPAPASVRTRSRGRAHSARRRASVRSAQRREQGMAIEPAFPAAVSEPAAQIRRVQPRIARRERPLDRAASPAPSAPAESPRAPRAAARPRERRKIEIGRLHETEVRRRAGMPQAPRRIAQKLESERRQRDVDRRGELQADGARRARARRLAIAGVRLDHQRSSREIQHANAEDRRRPNPQLRRPRSRRRTRWPRVGIPRSGAHPQVLRIVHRRERARARLCRAASSIS